MPIPLIAAAAIVAGVIGVKSGVEGGLNMHDAQEKEKKAKDLHKENLHRFDTGQKNANESLDGLGLLELDVLESFGEFCDIVQRLQNAPEFAEIDTGDISLPEFNAHELKDVSVIAKATVGGLAGAATGTAGGFAAAGATTAIVSAIGTASTGTAISALSGAAATNATLAAIGGGTLAAGGGGIAAGSAILGGVTAGVGLLVGGIIMGTVGNKLSKDADELWKQVEEEKSSVDEACVLFSDIENTAEEYYEALSATHQKYLHELVKVSYIVNDQGKTDWNDFTDIERLTFKNTVLLVGLLYRMCQARLIVADDDGKAAYVNHKAVKASLAQSEKALADLTR